jgi:hypothetical protein
MVQTNRLNSVIDNSFDDAAWRSVPFRVRHLFIKYAAAARAQMASDPTELRIPTDEFGTLIVKVAEEPAPAAPLPAPLAPITRAYEGAQSLMGGPNPLTSMLLSGALGAGLGWGGGWLLRKLMPGYFRDDLTKFTTPIGAVLGAAVPGVLEGYPNVSKLGWRGLFTAAPYQGGPDYPAEKTSNYAGTLERLKVAMDMDEISRMSMDPPIPDGDNISGGLYVSDINVNRWANLVSNDPYIPEPNKALMAGLPMAAGASKGTWAVSPSDVGRVAAGAGLGYAYGTVLGSLASPFLRLTPKAQQDIQRAGLFAGAAKALGFL